MPGESGCLLTGYLRCDWAPFHCEPSAGSVKVVRHKKSSFCCGKVQRQAQKRPGCDRLSTARMVNVPSGSCEEIDFSFLQVIENVSRGAKDPLVGHLIAEFSEVSARLFPKINFFTASSARVSNGVATICVTMTQLWNGSGLLNKMPVGDQLARDQRYVRKLR